MGWALLGSDSSIMARNRIKSRASFKSEVWTGKRESVESSGTEVSWSSSHDADLKRLELVSGGESGFVMITGVWLDFGPAGDTMPFGSPVLRSIDVQSPAGFKLPSSYLVMRSGSKARAVVGVVNPWKIKSHRISAT